MDERCGRSRTVAPECGRSGSHRAGRIPGTGDRSAGGGVMKATARDLIGRRITAVNFRPFRAGTAGNPRGTAHDPIITLDNGVKLFFIAEETEMGEYGTCICRTAVPGHEWRQKR